MNEAKKARRDLRFVTESSFDLAWNDRISSSRRSALVRGRDISASGARIESSAEIPPSTPVHIQSSKYNLSGTAHVRHCSPSDGIFLIGVEFAEETRAVLQMFSSGHIDYYEVLQIHSTAETDTIHRIYRIMAGRFHPDNANTGNADRFLLLKKAYEVLSDPLKRAAYDKVHGSHREEVLPIFDSRDFVDDARREINRRLGVLGLLFIHRRSDPEQAGKSLLDLERLMGFPREYLRFTLWYLLEKGYVCRVENSDYAITAQGIDYLEATMPHNQIVQRLLANPFGVEEKESATESVSCERMLAEAG